ncbi:MAG: AAA family ATPase [Acidimicrobiaceae bacterium]|nr:AAA family ATPase [Acidimicrobiaceae bacterium]
MSVPSDTDQTQLWQQRLEEYLKGLSDRGRSHSLMYETSSVLKDWIGYTLSRGTDPATFGQDRVDQQLDDRNPNLAEGSRRSYTGHIKRWCEHWQTQDTRSGQWHALESSNRQHQRYDESEYWEDRLEEYFEQLRDQGYEEPTIKTKRYILRRWISHSLARGADPGEFDQTQARHNLLEQSSDLSEGSLEHYLGHIRRWCEYLESLQDDETELWGQRMKEYLDHLRVRGFKDSVDDIGNDVHRWIEQALTQDQSPDSFDEALINSILEERGELADSTVQRYVREIRRWCDYWQSQAQTPRAWVVRAGANGEAEQHNLNHSVTTMGWDLDETWDLEQFASRQELGEFMIDLGHTHLGTSPRDQIWRFGREMQVGDLLVMPQKRPEVDSRQVAIGRVQGPYQYDTSFGDGLRRRRAVEWLQTDISREALGADLNDMLNRPPTVYALRNHDAPYRIQYLAEHGVDPGDRNPSVEQDPADTDELEMEDRLADAAERLYCEREYLQELVGLLEDKGQIILYGPPGTGKTYLAQELAVALAPAEAARSLVQFHPAYSYEDFFEGYRPVTDDDGQMTYELTPGPLSKLALHATDHPDQQHVMVIDEINRANLPRVLGELLYLLEYRDKSIAVMHRPDDSFKLPKNLWFIGTMNTADRSIALIDAAMRRRFHFVPFFPEREPTASLLRKWTDEHAPDQAWVPDLVSAVNKELEKELGGEHLQLGPSHFMKRDLNDGGFERVWRYNIEPFIEDQLFGKQDKVEQFRLDAVLQRHGRAELALQEADLADDSEPTSAPTKPDRSTSGRQNNDAMVTGREIYDNYQAGDRTYTWMGRQSGISGTPLRDDLDSGAWRSREYEVRHQSITGNRNWFSIEDFVTLVDELNGPDGDESPAGDE